MPADAQVLSGNIYGQVTDESGAVVAGATIQLKGANVGGLSTTSDPHGDFHFLALDPGTYTVSASQTGFATTVRDVIVSTAINVEIVFNLKVAAVSETVNVTDKTPVVDTKKHGTGITLSQDELQRTPNSRDVWALLRTVPGVLVHQENIAGSWNDQQDFFYSKSADFADSTFILDGTNITDDGGGSSTYFDFDSFQEISASTGGSDLRAQTGGVNINLTTKRGTNQIHGSARGFFTHDSLEWSNLPPALVGDPRLQLPDGTFSDKADYIRQLAEYGAEVGGPIVKDKLWIWGAYGHQDIRVVRFGNGNLSPKDTGLGNWNAKLNWQASGKDVLSLVYVWSEKEKTNVSPGYTGQAENSFLLRQGNTPISGPRGLFKLEESHVFSPDWFLNATYSYYGWGYGFTPNGGVSEDGGVDYLRDLSIGSSYSARTTRYWKMGDLDLRNFRSGLGGGHELRFGFGYRHTPISSLTAYSGSKVLAERFTSDGGLALVYRDSIFSYDAQSWDTYLGDTYTRGRLTLNVGLRYDHQTASNLPSFAAANPAFPELLPALDFSGGGTGVHWDDLSPRAAATYSLDRQRKTVARLSYARYAGRITALDATFDNPIGSGSYGAYLAYNWVDLNHDGLAQKDEVLIEQGVVYASPGLDPAHPTSLTTTKRLDPNYTARHDDEIITGIERELRPDLALSAAYTWRRNTNRNWTPRIGLTQADYTPNPPVTANGFTAQTYSPEPAKVAASGNGTILTNRPDYEQRYNGIELSLTKRLSKRWMARAGVAYMSLRESFLGPAAIQNPTHGVNGNQVNGGQISPARWQLSADALYELPRGFEAAASFWARQGYANPYSLRLGVGADGTINALATLNVEEYRLPDVADLDLRLAKTVKLRGDSALVLSAEMFNLFNSGTVVGSHTVANLPVFGQINTILNPRIVRFGARLTF